MTDIALNFTKETASVNRLGEAFIKLKAAADNANTSSLEKLRGAIKALGLSSKEELLQIAANTKSILQKLQEEVKSYQINQVFNPTSVKYNLDQVKQAVVTSAKDTTVALAEEATKQRTIQVEAANAAAAAHKAASATQAAIDKELHANRVAGMQFETAQQKIKQAELTALFKAEAEKQAAIDKELHVNRVANMQFEAAQQKIKTAELTALFKAEAEKQAAIDKELHANRVASMQFETAQLKLQEAARKAAAEAARLQVAAATNNAVGSYQRYNPNTGSAGALVNAPVNPIHPNAVKDTHALNEATLSLTGSHKILNDGIRGLVQSLGMYSATMTSIIPMLAGMALGMAAIKPLKVGAEFEQSMFVIHEVAGTSTADMVKVKDAVLDIGKSTQYGPLEAAKGLETLALAGLSTVDALKAIIPVLHFAATGAVPVKEAAETLVAVATAYKYSAQNIEAVGDVIAKTAADSMASVTDMSAAFKMSTIVAQQYGMSLNDTAMAMGMLAQIGIRGTAAGTSYRNMLTEFNKGSGKAADGIKLLGVELKNADGSAKDLMTTMESLSKGLITKDVKSQGRLLDDIANERGGKSLAAYQAAFNVELNKSHPLLQQEVNLLNQAGKSVEAKKVAEEAVAAVYARMREKAQENIDSSAAYTFFVNLEEQFTTLSTYKGLLASLETDFVKAFTTASDSTKLLTLSLRETLNSAEFTSAIATLTNAVLGVVKVLAELVAFTLDSPIASVAGLTAAFLTCKVAVAGLGIAVAAIPAAVAAGMELLTGTAAAIAVAFEVGFGVAVAATVGLAAAVAAVVAGIGYLIYAVTDSHTAVEKTEAAKREEYIKTHNTIVDLSEKVLASQQGQIDIELSRVAVLNEVWVENRRLTAMADAAEWQSITALGGKTSEEGKKYHAQAEALRAQRVTASQAEAKVAGEAMIARINMWEETKLQIIEATKLQRIFNAETFLGGLLNDKGAAISTAQRDADTDTKATKTLAENARTRAKTSTEALVAAKAAQQAYAALDAAAAKVKPYGTGVGGYAGKPAFVPRERTPAVEQVKLETSNILEEMSKRDKLVLEATKTSAANEKAILDSQLAANMISKSRYAAEIAVLEERTAAATIADLIKQQESRVSAYITADAKVLASQVEFNSKNSANAKAIEANDRNIDKVRENNANKLVTESMASANAIKAITDKAHTDALVAENKHQAELQKIKKEGLDWDVSEAELKAKNVRALATSEAVRNATPLQAAVLTAQVAEFERLTANAGKHDAQIKELTDSTEKYNESLANGIDFSSEGLALAEKEFKANQKEVEVLDDLIERKDKLTGVIPIEIDIKGKEAVTTFISVEGTRIRDGLTDAIMNAGKDGGKGLWDFLQAELLTRPFRMQIQALVQPFAQGMANMMYGTAANVATGASATSGLLGAGGTVANFFTPVNAAVSQFGIAALESTQALFGLANAGTAATVAELAGTQSLMSTLGGAVPYAAIALLAAAAIDKIANAGEQRFGASYTADATGKATLQNAPSGGEIVAKTARDIFEATQKNINQVLKDIGSNATVAGFVAGLESSGDGKGFAYAGGTIDGKGFGDYLGRDGGQFAMGSRSAEQALLDYANEMRKATLEALQAAADIPATISDQLAGVNIDSLTGEQLTALESAVGKTIAEIKATITGLQALPIAGFSDLSANAAGNLIKASGGFDKLNASVTAYYSGFVSDNDKLAKTFASTAESFGKLGLAMPGVNGGLKDWYEGAVDAAAAMDLTKPANAQHLADLLSSAEAMNAVLGPMDAFSESMQQLPWQFDALKNMSYEAATGLAAAAGGFDALAGNLNSFYSNFYTEEERSAQSLSTLAAGFTQIGLAMPAVDSGLASWYRAAVETSLALDQSVPGNAAFTASLLAMNGAVASAVKTNTSMAGSAKDSAAAGINAVKAVDTSSLALDNLAQAAKSPAEELAATSASLDTAASAAAELTSAINPVASAFSSAASGITDAVNAINALTITNSAATAATLDGSHAGGLAYVPFDGYLAELHRGERVLTASEASRMAMTTRDAATDTGATEVIDATSDYAKALKAVADEIKGFVDDLADIGKSPFTLALEKIKDDAQKKFDDIAKLSKAAGGSAGGTGEPDYMTGDPWMYRLDNLSLQLQKIFNKGDLRLTDSVKAGMAGGNDSARDVYKAASALAFDKSGASTYYMNGGAMVAGGIDSATWKKMVDEQLGTVYTSIESITKGVLDGTVNIDEKIKSITAEGGDSMGYMAQLLGQLKSSGYFEKAKEAAARQDNAFTGGQNYGDAVQAIKDLMTGRLSPEDQAKADAYKQNGFDTWLKQAENQGKTFEDFLTKFGFDPSIHQGNGVIGTTGADGTAIIGSDLQKVMDDYIKAQTELLYATEKQKLTEQYDAGTTSTQAKASLNNLGYDVTGLSAEGIQKYFADILAAANPLTQEGQETIKELTDLGDSIALLGQVAQERQSWQDKLDVLSGRTTEAALQRQRDLASTTDAATLAIIKQVHAQEDAAKTAAATEDYTLQILQAQGDSKAAELKAFERSIDTKAKLEAGWTQTQIDSLYAITDAAEAAEKATEAAAKATELLSNKLDLQARLYELTGDATAAAIVLQQQHAIALEKLDPSLRALQQQIWDLEFKDTPLGKLAETLKAAGDAAGLLKIKLDLALADTSGKYTAGGQQYDAPNPNSATYARDLAIMRARFGKDVANEASANALTTGNIGAALASLSGIYLAPVADMARDISSAIVAASGDTANAVRDAVSGFAKAIATTQAKNLYQAAGPGIASVLAAQDNLASASASKSINGKTFYGSDVIAYQEAINGINNQLSKGALTADQAAKALTALNEAAGGVAETAADVYSQLSNIARAGQALQDSGMASISFYFDKITESAKALTVAAKEAGTPLSETASGIARLNSLATAMTTSAQAVVSGGAAAMGAFSEIATQAAIDLARDPTDSAASSALSAAQSSMNYQAQINDALLKSDKYINAGIIAAAAQKAADAFTTADTEKVKETLKASSEFAKALPTELRDMAILLDGIEQFDAKSFEDAFTRINAALIDGTVTAGQYGVLFNTALKSYTAGLEDNLKALSDAVESSRQSIASAYKGILSSAESAAKSLTSAQDNITTQYLAAQDEVASAQEAIANISQQAASAMAGFSKTIRDFTVQMDTTDLGSTDKAQQIAALQADFAITAAKARAGDTTAMGDVTGKAQNLLTAVRAQFTSAEDFAMFSGSIRGTLSDIATIADGKAGPLAQAVDPMIKAQQQLLVAQEKLNKLTEAAAKSGATTTKAVVDYLADWRVAEEANRKAQADLLKAQEMTAGIDLALLGTLGELAKLIEKYNTDTAVLKAAVASNAGASSATVAPTESAVVSASSTKWPWEVYSETQTTPVTPTVADTTPEWLKQSNIAWAIQNGLPLPSYDVGTNYVPYDMVAKIHKGESIVPAAYNPANGGNAELIAEIKALREELAAIKSYTRATAGHTAGTDRKLARVIKNDAITTEAAV